jgi:Fur family transcriptional regulator, peroxide stress response regulator
MKNYKLLLNNANLKATKQRIGILTIIEEIGHISIDDLLNKIKESSSSISLATLYKSINEMLSKGVLSDVKVKNSKTHFEISKGRHAHMYCEKCQNIIDIEFEFEKINTSAFLTKNHFILTNTDLTFTGICSECTN